MLQRRDWKLTPKSWETWITRYTDSEIPTKAEILYFHGGGLLYGSRNDLPEYHIELLTQAGYEIIAFDYPLAPAANLEQILSDICDSINTFCAKHGIFRDTLRPYFLWGRSAGAYLCLIAAASGRLLEKPVGILSYYGYGFLCDSWHCTPSNYYLQLPPVPKSCLESIPRHIHTSGSLETHYSIYVYARQTGCWNKLIYQGREKFFYLNYSLRMCEKIPCPVFAAHSTGDPDVPYGEFVELCNRYHAQKFIASGNVHDFDRDPDSPFTAALLESTLCFLDAQMK